jgi:hypothetical protein
MLTLVGNEKRTNPTSKSFESYMIEAERCCENADHDIIDATLAYVTSHLASVVRDFGLKNVAIFFPDYSHVRSRLKQLQSLVLESRADRSRRDEIYDTLLRGFDEIVEFETTILAVEDDILLAVQSEQARENRTKWITRVSLGFGFIGIVIGFVGLVY